MNLYDELFPEDSYEGEEKTASRAMDYFGIRFEDRVEKLAGVKEMYEGAKRLGTRAWDATKDYHRKGVSGVKGGTEKMRIAASERFGKVPKGYKRDVAGAKAMFGEGAKETALGAARFAPHAAGVGALGTGAYYGLKGKKKRK